jgi:hypothetical protein
MVTDLCLTHCSMTFMRTVNVGLRVNDIVYGEVLKNLIEVI